MYYILNFLSALCASIGQICLKIGSANKSHLYDFFNFINLIGCILYFIGLVLWIVSLSKLPLSVAYAFTLLTFFMVFIFSHYILAESISKMAYVGFGFVLIGFLCIFFGQISNKIS